MCFMNKVLNSTKQHLGQTLTSMDELQEKTKSMKYHKEFHSVISKHREVLQSFYNKISTLQCRGFAQYKQIGKVRYLEKRNFQKLNHK